MRFDSIPHLIGYFIAIVAVFFILRALFLSSKNNKQAQNSALLPTGYPADSMATAHADLNQLSGLIKSK